MIEEGLPVASSSVVKSATVAVNTPKSYTY